VSTRQGRLSLKENSHFEFLNNSKAQQDANAMYLLRRKKKAPAVPAPNSAEFGIIDKLTQLWTMPIAQLPVYKDLPRLTSRITVSGSLNRQAEHVEEEVTDVQYAIWVKTELPDVFYKYVFFELIGSKLTQYRSELAHGDLCLPLDS